ncbi:MAG: threonine synthase [Elusimicrobia bacterium RIFOXYD12_FULL_66_9]|nr:MAG: threonine synthase [Elusimicrobia bacterium RIFOXYD12_FULL_66_9]
MKKIEGFRCVTCAAECGLTATKYVCPRCSGNLSVVYDYKALRRSISRRSLKADPERSIWRYLPILPLNGRTGTPPVHVGWTPLYRVRKLGAALGLKNLYLKDDGRNPSASFKDRASAVVAARALETGEKTVAGASTGNAAASLACMMADRAAKPVIFVPRTAPAAKLAQLLIYGAVVFSVDGTYDQAFDLCRQACDEFGWYNRNTGYNPFTREGKKTCAFELCEQLGWKVPGFVFVSVGDGNIISGLWKGFTDFHALGLIDKLPRMIAVQAEGSAAIALALKNDGPIRPVEGRTVADSISVSLPRDGAAAVAAIKGSKGFAVTVSDRDILAAIPALAQGANVFAEPAGAAAYAGLAKCAKAGKVREDDSAVIVVTGSGLKDVASAMKVAGRPHEVGTTMSSVRSLVAREKIS